MTGGDANLTTSITRVGNTITLQPGTYFIEADGDSYRDNGHQLVLRDVTDGTGSDPDLTTAVIRGLSSNNGSGGSDFGESSSSLKGIVTVEGKPRQYQLWHYLYGIAGDHNAIASALGYASAPKNMRNRYSQIAVIRIK